MYFNFLYLIWKKYTSDPLNILFARLLALDSLPEGSNMSSFIGLTFVTPPEYFNIY